MMNETFLILKLLILHFLKEMFLAPLPIVCTFRNFFVLQEYVLMLMTSTTKTNCYLNQVLCKTFFLYCIIDTQS